MGATEEASLAAGNLGAIAEGLRDALVEFNAVVGPFLTDDLNEFDRAALGTSADLARVSRAVLVVAEMTAAKGMTTAEPLDAADASASLRRADDYLRAVTVCLDRALNALRSDARENDARQLERIREYERLFSARITVLAERVAGGK